MKKALDTPDIVYYNGEAVTSAHIGNHCPGRPKTRNCTEYEIIVVREIKEVYR